MGGILTDPPPPTARAAAGGTWTDPLRAGPTLTSRSLETTPEPQEGRLRLLPFEPEGWLEGPGADAPPPRREGASSPITGGGLVAILSPTDGVRGLWRGALPLSGPLSVSVEGGGELHAAEATLGGGGWRRRLELPDRGGWVEECGLLPDAESALVLQWRWVPQVGGPRPTSDLLTLRLQVAEPLGEGVLEAELPLFPDTPAAVALLPRERSVGAALLRLRPLRARERQREDRWGMAEAGGGVRIEIDGGAAAATFTGALRALDGAPLSTGGTEGAGHELLAGVDAGSPTFLTGAALEEVALAALAAGRIDLARRILEGLAAAGGPSPSPLTRLAPPWIAWTGESGTVRRLDPTGSAAIDAALRPEGGAATPSPPTSAPRLPILGGSRRGAAPVAGGKGTPAPLPPPDAFGDPEHPAFAPRRTVHGARLIRSWIEGELGVRPDALVGRLRLGPRIHPGWKALLLTGLRMGDARVRCEFRRDGANLSFLLRQDGGRVPIDLVFEPWLPIEEVREVRIGEGVAEVEITREGSGTRLRCQFPLDPERRVTVIGRGLDG